MHITRLCLHYYNLMMSYIHKQVLTSLFNSFTWIRQNILLLCEEFFHYCPCFYLSECGDYTVLHMSTKLYFTCSNDAPLKKYWNNKLQHSLLIMEKPPSWQVLCGLPSCSKNGSRSWISEENNKPSQGAQFIVINHYIY